VLVRCYRDLLVWQKAVDLVTGCYAFTKLLPKSHLSIANGSLMELETHIVIAQRLNYLGANDVDHILSLAGELSRMLTGLTKKLSARRTNT
jgi:hypothetical protein